VVANKLALRRWLAGFLAGVTGADKKVNWNGIVHIVVRLTAVEKG
jgi:hypothetical protein